VTRPRDVPLALYIHLPWCVRKCPYCVSTHALPSAGIPQQAYVAALLEDLGFAWRQPIARSSRVFFGGGTRACSLDRSHRCRAVRAHLPFASGAEVTLEANPTSSAADLPITRPPASTVLRSARRLRRRQARGNPGASTPRDRAVVADLRAAGMTNFNLDLMYAAGATLGEALHDVERVIEPAPTHVSHYQLTLEAGTPFATSAEPAGRRPHDMQAAAERLAAAGYAQYEIPPTRGRGVTARTTSTTGNTATTLASALARTAS
jgi:oxygen-independent coproporphyrinogen-3 oxidase